MLVYLPFLFSITLALLFFDIANGFQVALEGASTTTVPASVTGTFQRESGDPSGITIRVVDISDPSGPRVIQTEDPPDSEQSGSFPITLTTPGVFALQAGPGTSTVVDSDTVTVLDSTGSSNGKVITTSTASASSQTKDTSLLSSSAIVASVRLSQSSSQTSLHTSSQIVSNAPNSKNSTIPQTLSSSVTFSSTSSKGSSSPPLSHSSLAAPSTFSSAKQTTIPSRTITPSATQTANARIHGQSVSTGRVVGEVIGTLSGVLSLSLALFLLFRSRRSVISAWASSISGNFTRRFIGRRNKSSQRPWYRVSGHEPTVSFAPIAATAAQAPYTPPNNSALGPTIPPKVEMYSLDTTSNHLGGALMRYVKPRMMVSVGQHPGNEQNGLINLERGGHSIGHQIPGRNSIPSCRTFDYLPFPGMRPPESLSSNMTTAAENPFEYHRYPANYGIGLFRTHTGITTNSESPPPSYASH